MIRKYVDSDFEILTSWISNSDILFQCAGTDFSYPLTDLQLIAYKILHPDRIFYLYLDNDSNPIGIGEIIPQVNNIPRLGRLLIGNHKNRNKGIGTHFIKLLIQECIHLYNSDSVDLYVWENNDSAIKCYQKVGFNFTENSSFYIYHNNIEFKILEMSIKLK
ncbi:MAG: GNAT family N-acetyltransferase [Candidatus Kapabacteria bacterium]|nr:GNAT family N-acetyltransferase [Candidatus Kapabacteria bacterium]